MLVLGVVSFLAVGAFGVFRMSQNQNEVQATVKDTGVIIAGIENRANVGANLAVMGNEFAIKSGFVPKTMIDGSSPSRLKSAWGGEIELMPAGGRGWAISFDKVPVSTCSKLVAAMSPMFTVVSINGVAVKDRAQGNQSLLVSDMAARCGEEGEKVLVFGRGEILLADIGTLPNPIPSNPGGPTTPPPDTGGGTPPGTTNPPGGGTNPPGNNDGVITPPGETIDDPVPGGGSAPDPSETPPVVNPPTTPPVVDPPPTTPSPEVPPPVSVDPPVTNPVEPQDPVVPPVNPPVVPPNPNAPPASNPSSGVDYDLTITSPVGNVVAGGNNNFSYRMSVQNIGTLPASSFNFTVKSNIRASSAYVTPSGSGFSSKMCNRLNDPHKEGNGEYTFSCTNTMPFPAGQSVHLVVMFIMRPSDGVAVGDKYNVSMLVRPGAEGDKDMSNNTFSHNFEVTR